MSNPLQIYNITNQIQSYVRQIQNRRQTINTSSSSLEEALNPFISYAYINDIRSNLNSLAGQNKFKIQQMLEASTDIMSSMYIRSAYEYLTLNTDDKQRVVLDFLHKNNRNYDLTV